MTNRERFLAGHKFRTKSDLLSRAFYFEKLSKDSDGFICFKDKYEESRTEYFCNLEKIGPNTFKGYMVTFGLITLFTVKFSDLIFFDDDK